MFGTHQLEIVYKMPSPQIPGWFWSSIRWSKNIFIFFGLCLFVIFRDGAVSIGESWNRHPDMTNYIQTNINLIYTWCLRSIAVHFNQRWRRGGKGAEVGAGKEGEREGGGGGGGGRGRREEGEVRKKTTRIWTWTCLTWSDNPEIYWFNKKEEEDENRRIESGARAGWDAKAGEAGVVVAVGAGAKAAAGTGAGTGTGAKGGSR